MLVTTYNAVRIYTYIKLRRNKSFYPIRPGFGILLLINLSLIKYIA